MHTNAVAAHMNLLEVQERLIKLCLFLTHNKTVSKQREHTRKHQEAYNTLSTGTDSNQQHT